VITEDTSAYFADFGVPCTRGAETFVAIYDAPADVIGLGEVDAVSLGESILYRTAAVALAYGDTVIVDGTTFKVNEVRAIDDGQLSRARIGRP
jgi:hypothetical protein